MTNENEELGEVVGKLPFMPEKGPPLPEYVSEELYKLESFKAPVSDYGSRVVEETAKRLDSFLKAGSFTVVDKLEETGWSSEDIAYNGTFRHEPTGIEWIVELWVSFGWRKPEEIESMYVDFLGSKKDEGKWISAPDEITESDKWSYDLTAEEGAKAGRQAQEFIEKGWYV